MILISVNRAVRRGDKAAVDSILKAKGDPNEIDSDGWTPLHHAAYEGNTGIAESLIVSKANPNLKEKGGGTPLHWAARKGDTSIIKTLIVSKADPNLKNRFGKTPEDVARICEHHEAYLRALDEAAAARAAFEKERPMIKAQLEAADNIASLQAGLAEARRVGGLDAEIAAAEDKLSAQVAKVAKAILLEFARVGMQDLATPAVLLKLQELGVREGQDLAELTVDNLTAAGIAPVLKANHLHAALQETKVAAALRFLGRVSCQIL